MFMAIALSSYVVFGWKSKLYGIKCYKGCLFRYEFNSFLEKQLLPIRRDLIKPFQE